MAKTLAKRLELSPDRLPWHKQPGESKQAFEAFAAYRDLGYRRSLAIVAKDLGKSEGLIGGWSSKNRWQERMDAYDLETDRRMLAAKDDEKERVVREETAMALTLQDVLERRLTGGEDGSGIVALHPNEIDAKDVPRFMDTVFKHRRLAAGLATEHSAVAVKMVDFERWVDKFIEETIDFVDPGQRQTWLERLQALGVGQL